MILGPYLPKCDFGFELALRILLEDSVYAHICSIYFSFFKIVNINLIWTYIVEVYAKIDH